MKAKISKRSVDALKPGTSALILWDTEIPGFGCKVTPKGVKTYLLKYSRYGRARWFTIGRHGSDYTPEKARKIARRVREQVSDGRDPAGEKSKAREAPTFAEFADLYLDDHAKVKKKLTSVAADERNLRNHVLPALGRYKVQDISRSDVLHLHQSMRSSPGAANRCLALLSKMFNLAEKWGYRPDSSNPVRHVEKYPERKLERYLSDLELAALGKALASTDGGAVSASFVGIVRLLILTGCRRNEILELKWDHVDLSNCCLKLPDSKTGAKVVPLGPPAATLLSNLKPVKNNPYVFPGRRRAGHFNGMGKAWRRLRDRATLEIWQDDDRYPDLASVAAKKLRQPIGDVHPTTVCDAIEVAAKEQDIHLSRGMRDVRLHDLRHSFASVAASMGESLTLIGAVLGHHDQATTARYAHLSDDPRQATAERVSNRISAIMESKPSGTVIPLSETRRA